MNEARLYESIERHEGYRDKPYQCSEGYWTVGWGHKIHDMELRALMPHRTMASLLDWLCSKGTHALWLEKDVNAAVSNATRFVGPHHYAILTDARQEVLIEMAFQLGGTGLSGFRKFRQAILDEDWHRAADEMLDSRWCTQTPERARELASNFLAG